MNKKHDPAAFQASLEGWISIVANLALFAVKFWIGVSIRSVAIIADAWHTLSDTLSSVVVIAGIKISRRPADAKHPFGHGRAEALASMVIGMLLAVVAVEFLWDAVIKLKNSNSTDYSPLAFWIIVASVVIKEVMAQYAFFIGRKYNLEIIRADGWHHRSDAISSLVILVAIVIGQDYWWLDGVLGIIVSLILIHTAYTIIRHAVEPILGSTPSPAVLEQVNNICHEVCGDSIRTHHFHIHDYGNHRELTFHLRLDGGLSLEQAHTMATEVETLISQRLELHPTIHMEPLRKYTQ